MNKKAQKYVQIQLVKEKKMKGKGKHSNLRVFNWKHVAKKKKTHNSLATEKNVCHISYR